MADAVARRLAAMMNHAISGDTKCYWSLAPSVLSEHGGLIHGGSPPQGDGEEEGRPQNYSLHHLERDLREGGHVRADGQHDPVPHRAVPHAHRPRHRSPLLLERHLQLPAHLRRRARRRPPRTVPGHRPRLLRQPLRDVPAVPDGDPPGVQEDAGVRGGEEAGGWLRGASVAAAVAVHVVRAHVVRVGRHPALHAGVRGRPAGQAGQQRQEREDAADLLQLVLHGAGTLHRVRGHRYRVHPAGQGLGRRLHRARRAHGHRAHALPPRLALLRQGAGRQERPHRLRAGARRQLQEPPRAPATGDRRRLQLLQQSRLQAQGSHEQAKVPEPDVRAQEPGQGAQPRRGCVRSVAAVHGAAGGGRQGRHPRAPDMVDGDHARRDRRAADVPDAASQDDGADGGQDGHPRGLLRRLRHPDAHRLGGRVRPRAGAAPVPAHRPRARAQPAAADGRRPGALRRGHGRGRAHRERPPSRRDRPGAPRPRPRQRRQHCAHVGHETGAAALPDGARRGPQPDRADRVLLLGVSQDHDQHRGVAARARPRVRRRAGRCPRRGHPRGDPERWPRRLAARRPEQGALRPLLLGPGGAVRSQRGVLRGVWLGVRRGGAEPGGGRRRRRRGRQGGGGAQSGCNHLGLGHARL